MSSCDTRGRLADGADPTLKDVVRRVVDAVAQVALEELHCGRRRSSFARSARSVTPASRSTPCAEVAEGSVTTATEGQRARRAEVAERVGGTKVYHRPPSRRPWRGGGGVRRVEAVAREELDELRFVQALCASKASSSCAQRAGPARAAVIRDTSSAAVASHATGTSPRASACARLLRALHAADQCLVEGEVLLSAHMTSLLHRRACLPTCFECVDASHSCALHALVAAQPTLLRRLADTKRFELGWLV